MVSGVSLTSGPISVSLKKKMYWILRIGAEKHPKKIYGSICRILFGASDEKIFGFYQKQVDWHTGANFKSEHFFQHGMGFSFLVH